MTTIHAAETYVIVTCGAQGCSETFGMRQAYCQARLADGKGWYCPDGHLRCWPKGETEESRLRNQLAYANARVEHLRKQRDRVKNQTRALRGVVTKTRRRIAHGVCPCCQRTFQNVARHMRSKHPEEVRS